MISTEANYVSLSEFSQEVKFFNMLMEEMSKLHKLAIVYKDNQGDFFLAKNRQFGICTAHVNIRDHFLRDMLADKDTCINYISIKENPAVILTKNFSEANHAKHAKRATEKEIWELVETGRENVNNNRILDGLICCE